MQNLYFRKLLSVIILVAVLCVAAAPCQALAPPSPTAEAPAFSESEALTYFTEVVFAAEYGGDDTQSELKRWEQPIRVQVYGSPTDEDLLTLDRHIAALGQVENMPAIARVSADGNVQFFFVPLNEIGRYIKDYVKDNWGFFWGWWNDDLQMTNAQIAIATDVTDQRQRNHLILEEFTQALGIMQDSLNYPDSIFYGRWTEVQQLSPLDWMIVQMVYDPGLEPGMTAVEAIDALQK